MFSKLEKQTATPIDLHPTRDRDGWCWQALDGDRPTDTFSIEYPTPLEALSAWQAGRIEWLTPQGTDQ